MLRTYVLAWLDENRSYKFELNKLEKHNLDAYMNQISSKSVQQFERKSVIKNVFWPRN